MKNIFQIDTNGIETKCDRLFVSKDRESLKEKMTYYLDPTKSLYNMKEKFGVSEWLYERSRGLKFNNDLIQRATYRPFDNRWTYYHPKVLGRARHKVLDNMLFSNMAVLVTRQVSTGSFRHVFVSSCLVDRDPLSLATRERTQAFPLYIYPKLVDRTSLNNSLFKTLNYDKCQLNLYDNIIQNFKKNLGIKFTFDKKDDIDDKIFCAEDVLRYIYAILHSQNYRSRYEEFLKVDFPRIPMLNNLMLFNNLLKLGGKLVNLHIMESPELDKHITQFLSKGNKEVEKIYYLDETVWIDKAKTQGFHGVPENVWNFHVGGYQVCQKWLKDRKGRTLSEDDINHYHRIIVALNETISIMTEIDKVIEEHGGWPDAFLNKQEEYKVQAEPLQKVAEKKPEQYIPKTSTLTHKSIPSSKNDWKTWLALSRWVKEKTQINTYWAGFALEISNKLKKGSRLTDKQNANMKKCWTQAVNMGFEIPG